MNFGRKQTPSGKKTNLIQRNLSPISSSWENSRQFIEALKRVKHQIKQDSELHYIKNKEEAKKLTPPDLFRFHVLKQIEALPEGLTKKNLKTVNQTLRTKAYELYGQTSLLMGFLMVAIVVGAIVFILNIGKPYWGMVLLQYILSILIFSQVYLSVRFKTWCLLRKLSGLSFLQWLKKGYYKDSINPEGGDPSLLEDFKSLGYLFGGLFNWNLIKTLLRFLYKGTALEQTLEEETSAQELPVNELFKDLNLTELEAVKLRMQMVTPASPLKEFQ